jgi:hypothetical protein
MPTTMMQDRTTGWLAEARRHLEPASGAGAEFFDRWAAARYAGDQLRHHLARDAARFRARHGALASDVVRLEHDVAALAADIDELGRRRGTGAAVAARATALLSLLPKWVDAMEEPRERWEEGR